MNWYDKEMRQAKVTAPIVQHQAQYEKLDHKSQCDLLRLANIPGYYNSSGVPPTWGRLIHWESTQQVICILNLINKISAQIRRPHD